MKLFILRDCLVGTEAHSPESVVDVADEDVAKALVAGGVARAFADDESVPESTGKKTKK